MEEAVDLLSGSVTHKGLQVSGSSAAELLDAGEVLQQGQSFDFTHPRNLLHQSQDQRVPKPRRTLPSEGVVSALPVDLETVTAGFLIS